MLQKLNHDPELPETDASHLLRPAYYLGVFKRRWLYFLIPFVFVMLVGAVTIYMWPATYFSEGKILVQSQQIPTELVRPTVTSAAQERIQVIEQRTMTRDNLIAIADKFKLFPDRRTLMSPTQLVEQMKKNVKIAPYVQPLAFARGNSSQNPTIIFTVGFEDSNPQTAARVANDLMTRILNEDLRDRTNRAGETTKFLSREVQRLQAENTVIEAKIAQVKFAQSKPSAGTAAAPDRTGGQLVQLRAELAQKSAIYSERNFQIQALKRQIEAIEKAAPAAPAALSATTTGAQPDPGLDALEVQQKNIQLSLDAASAKLTAARLGETLERDQQSEKLEVIDQPTVPQEPIWPNRPKLLGIVAALALLLGAGCALGGELLDRAIRRSTDLLGTVDRELVVSIPFIFTNADIRRRRRAFWFLIASSLIVLVVAILASYWLLPPLDLIIAKARVGLFR